MAAKALGATTRTPRFDVEAMQIGSLFLSALRHFESKLVEKGAGSTFEAISRDDLEQLSFPLPPLSEQRRIAGLLREQMAAAEKARAAAEKELNTINALPAALLRRAFSGEL
jgi:type I restriction enzyme S subunit